MSQHVCLCHSELSEKTEICEQDRRKEAVMNRLDKRFQPGHICWLACLAFLSLPIAHVAKAGSSDAEETRVKQSGDVLKELLSGENGIPLGLLNKAECVIVLPSVKKAGFIIGAQYGRGVMSCRSGPKFTGHWSAPIMMQSSGGSFGLQ